MSENSYTLELTFSGLCVFTFYGDKANPQEVNVLMVDTTKLAGHGKHGSHTDRSASTHEHFPLMSFSPRNLASGSEVPYILIPGSDGRQIGLIDLSGQRHLSLQPEGRGLTASWRKDEPVAETPDPDIPEQESWLNWVPSILSGHSEAPHPTKEPLAGLALELATARLRLTKGELKADRVAKHPNGEYAVWAFKDKTDKNRARQAIAQTIVLEIKGLTAPVTIDGHSGGYLGLTGHSSGETVRASFTNLPRVEATGPGEVSLKLDHFKHFYELFSPPLNPDGLALPETSDEVIGDTSTGAICPNSTFTWTS